MKNIIFENEYVVCYLNESPPVLVHEWLVEPPGFQFKKNLIAILEEYKKLRPDYPNLMWLANTKKLGEVSEEIEEWLVTEWDNMLFSKPTVNVHAVILGEDIYSDYPMEKFKFNAEDRFKSKGIKLGVFASEAEAYEWLEDNEQ